ncbi:hypothetical protein DNTS_005550 [Danionella cerebrum]|uniref:BRO1 domain-containing protein n=1 Tax=Danionella cerebrum TaxID=2873325 RepID=A0A553NJT3_9TELE|nr:hypothetical protein DNTS_005550 [Danionella translucida]
MEAVPRMPMIWLELKEAGEFQFGPIVRQYIEINYSENPENYSEAIKRLELLRQTVVNIPRDFEGCNTFRKYCGQLNYLQSRVPMAAGQEAAVPVTWTDVFTDRNISHDDINFEQACVLYNLGALHSLLGAVDNRLSEEGMKVSCTHFQCSAGVFTHLRNHFNHNFSSDLSNQALLIYISLMLAQAQECLLEKTLLDNRKNHLVAKICAQVCDHYKDSLRALDNSECLPGKILKEWRKLITMKISYFSAITHLHLGKQSEEQQKYGEAVAYFQSSLDKLNETIRQSKSQPEPVQEALKFTMDVIGGKYNSAKKDNDFIYHECVPGLDSLAEVKGASLVKPLPVSLTDQSVTGPDLFSKLVPMATHEASSLYSEEKARLLRDVASKIEERNQILERFMESLNTDSVYKVDMFKSLPDSLLEKCAFLSVRPDTVKNLVKAMQALSNVYTDVGSSLDEVRSALVENEAGEKSLMEVIGQKGLPPKPAAYQDIQKELKKYEDAHQTASKTNTELHGAMNQHIPNLRLLLGSIDEVRQSLPQPELNQDEMSHLQKMKTILCKVDEMRKQRISLESQLRDLIQKDDITGMLVTTDRADYKALFAEQLKKYDQLKGYIEQNLTAQENILKALTEANVQFAPVHKALIIKEQQWNSAVQSLMASFEAYEDLMKKAGEGRDFYLDLDKKTSSLLEKTKSYCQTREAERVSLLEREIGKGGPPRPSPMVRHNVAPRIQPSSLETVGPSVTSIGDRLQELQSIVPNQPQVSQGTNSFPPPHFLNQIPITDPNMKQQRGHRFLQNQTPYVQPSAPVQIPGLPPQQFQIRSAGGSIPVHSQINNPPASQVPALWQQPHPHGTSVPGGYFVPPQMSAIPQNSIMPGLTTQQMPNCLGQPRPAAIPQSSTVQPVVQGQSFTTQPRQGIPSTTQSAYPGQIHPPFPALQVQSLAAGQTSGLSTGFRHVMLPQNQPQPGLPGHLAVSQPQGAILPGQVPNQPCHPPENKAHPYIGYPPTSFPTPTAHQALPRSQIHPQACVSQNVQVPFAHPQIPPGAIPPQRNMYSFPPTHISQPSMGLQPIPTQFNATLSGPGGPHMYTPGPQNVALPSSGQGQAVTPVMDNPVPPSLASTLIPTPSSSLQSQKCTPTRNMSSSLGTQCSEPTDQIGTSTSLDSLQNNVCNLSLEPSQQSPPLSNAGSSQQTLSGSQDSTQSTIKSEDASKKDLFIDLDPLWSLNT